MVSATSRTTPARTSAPAPDAANKLLFYDVNGTLQATGTTTLNSGQTYIIDAKIGTGSSAPWEVRINSVPEINGTNNLGTTNNGSIKLGGSASYTDTYYFDDVQIDSMAWPGISPLTDGTTDANVVTQGPVGERLPHQVLHGRRDLRILDISAFPSPLLSREEVT